MFIRIIVALILVAAPGLASASSPKAAPTKPVEVMIVGGFHMSNPGRDLHNTSVDDVLAPKRQAEIAAVNLGLARFHPTIVAAEWDADVVAKRYLAYLDGTLKPSKNEVVQLGFRLAKTAGARMIGVDAETDFPYAAVETYAKAHGQTAVIDAAEALTVGEIAEEQRLIDHGAIAGVLRYLNDPVRLKSDNAWYRTMLRVGGGGEQPGAELLTQWYRRNFLICANLIQAAKPGDRMVVFYGAGHAFLLRQCVQETPGFVLVEPNAYLPR
jgi:hypothetical protein